MEASTRNITSWDLSQGGRVLTVWWVEASEKPSVPSRRTARFESPQPWQPWQVTGMIRSLRAGTLLEDVCAGDRPRLSGVQTAAAAFGDALLGAVDLLMGRKSLAGGAR